MEDSRTRVVHVINPQGLHARPAHSLAETAARFQAEVRVIRNGESVDGKSILSVMTLAAEQGTELTLKASGADAADALDALEALFLSGFGEAGEETAEQQLKQPDG